MSTTLVQIPVIDFAPFLSGDVAGRQTVVDQLYQACHEIGFVYLKNPGIASALVDQIFTQTQQFFHLPFDAKHQLAWSDEFSNRGYIGVEREHFDRNRPGDLKEAFNVGKEEEMEMEDGDMEGRGEKNPVANRWPADREFRRSVLTFYEACTEAADVVLQAFALALQLPRDFFATRHDEQHHTLRLLHYPPLQQSPKLGQVRAGEHSDYGSITLLFQDEIGGLEVQTASGEWIAAPYIPGTVIVNTGDLMQRWTNHAFCSTKHRVMIPTDDRTQRSRYSIAFFCHPNDDTEIACIPSCQAERSPIYPPISAGDYLLSRLQAAY